MDWRIGELALPSEIWNLIMKHLEAIDILRASIVNKISRACRLFVHTVDYSECSWSRFGETLLSMPNITKIDLGNIRDCNEFEKLTVLQKLQDLSLGRPTTRPILLYNVLEKITSLQILEMTYFPKNFEAIANSCTQITGLTLLAAKNDIIDEITAIQKLTKLRKLKLTVAQIVPKVDLVGLTHLTNLTSLALTGTNFNINLSRGDFNALTDLKTLKLREMNGQIGPGVEKLTKLEQFQTFHISDLEFSIFKDCLPLVSLTRLYVDSLTTKGRFAQLTDLTNLKSLQIDMAPGLKDHLPKMTALKKLILVGPVPIRLLRPLWQQMVQLEDFQIWTFRNESVDDKELQYLSNLNHLTSLLLYSFDGITSAGLYQTISKLTNLKSLDVSGKLLEANEMSSVFDMPSLSLVTINGAVEKE